MARRTSIPGSTPRQVGTASVDDDVALGAIAGKSPGIGGGGDCGREVAADADVSRECKCGVGMSEQRANHRWVEPDVEEQPTCRDVAKVMGVPDG
jgi:hypothetical protein